MAMEGNIISDKNTRKPRFYQKWCRHGCRFWCRKYFWEGQLQKNTAEVLDDEYLRNESGGPFGHMTPLRRKVLASIIPGLVCHFGWWAVMIQMNLWHLFPEKYFMTLTMIVGSIIAGMTSEGGGAIAFPVMTLAFQVNPSIARDFALMIQSFGMTAASVTIIVMKIHTEYTALVWGSVGGIAGQIIGLHFIDPYLTPPQKKMGFVSIWFSFAFALFLLNWNHKRRTFSNIPDVRLWKIAVIVLVGCIGGMFSSFSGSGIDICTFSVLTLLFRVSEKVATPTSVILMALNSIVGFFWRGLIIQEISTDAWQFLMVCIPVVTFGAPFGSFLGSHFHRLILAMFIYVIDTVALVSAFVIVPLTPVLAGVSVGIIVAGFFIFLGVTLLGHVLLRKVESKYYLKNSVDEKKVSTQPDGKDCSGNNRPPANGHVNQQAARLGNGQLNRAFED